IVLPLRTEELGMETISFLLVRTRVTSKVFSITSPVTSLMRIRSPILNGRIYVITNPATILAIAEEEPNENKIPINTETPLKTLESEPGKYGNISTNEKAYNRNRTML